MYPSFLCAKGTISIPSYMVFTKLGRGISDEELSFDTYQERCLISSPPAWLVPKQNFKLHWPSGLLSFGYEWFHPFFDNLWACHLVSSYWSLFLPFISTFCNVLINKVRNLPPLDLLFRFCKQNQLINPKNTVVTFLQDDRSSYVITSYLD
jgi:hypothetical protein